MTIKAKIAIGIVVIIIAVVSVFILRILGKPYYRISLLGTEYIENAEELSYANEQLDDKLYLIKKYKYSKDNLLLGFGGGNSVTDDYYSYGVAYKNKTILIAPKFQFISSKTNAQKEPIIFGLPYVENGDEKMMFYKITASGIELVEEKDTW